MVGDVEFEAAAAKPLSPVPGGVGSVTTALLMKNTVDAYTCNPASFRAVPYT